MAHDLHTMQLYELVEIVFNLTRHISLELHLTESRVVLILTRHSHRQRFAVAKQPEVIHF